MKKDNFQEQEIDLIHFLLKLASKWKILIILLVVGMLIGAGYSYTKMPKVEKYEDTHEVVPASKKLKLNDSEIGQVVAAANYISVYKEIKEYMDNSFITTMDDSTSLLEGRFYFALDEGERNDEISALLLSLAYDSDFYNQIKEEVGLDVSNEYLREIISIYKDMNNSDESLSGPASEYYVKMAGVVVTHTDRDLINSILESAKKQMEARLIKIQASYPKLQYKYLGSFISENSRTSIYERKMNVNNQMNTALSNYNKLVTTFTEPMNTALRKYLAGDASVIDSKKQSPKTYTESVFDVSVLLSGLLVGGVGLVFLYCVGFAVVYIFSDKIKVAENIERVTDSRVIFVKGKKQLKGLDKVIGSAIERKAKCFNSQDYAVESILISTADKAVIIADDDAVSEGKAIYDELSKKTQQISWSEGRLAENVLSLKKAVEDKNVWLIVKVNKTHLSTVCNELKIIDDNNLNLLGVIIV